MNHDLNCILIKRIGTYIIFLFPHEKKTSMWHCGSLTITIDTLS